ncbi:MAG TPA: hypothetical protein VIM52_05425 [Stellaceae bacterium]
MSTSQEHKPIVHFVGSVPLPDAETVFRTLAAVAGPHVKRLPDGETGIRKTWIRFLQGVLAENPAIDVATPNCRPSSRSMRGRPASGGNPPRSSLLRPARTAGR